MLRTAALAVPAAVVVALVATTAGPFAATGRHGAPAPLQLRSQLQDARAVDAPPTGTSAGDQLVFTERLLDARGRVVGTDAATCVRLFDQRSLCTGTYVLPGGQLMVQLVQPGPTGVYAQAVTGGTGRYAGARGTVVVDQRADGDRFTFRVRASGR
jgi:hypothetical protein